MRNAPLKFKQVSGIDSSRDAEAGPAPSKLATSLTLAAMSLGYGVVQLDITIVNTALNAIGTSLGGGVSELQWVVSAYTIAFAALILTAGALGDRLGLCDLHRRFARLRVGAECCDPNYGAGHPGGRRGDPGAELARTAQPRLSQREGPRPRRRHLGRRREPCAHRRPARRRGGYRSGRLAQHFFGHPANRPRGPVADLALCPGDAGIEHA